MIRVLYNLSILNKVMVYALTVYFLLITRFCEFFPFLLQKRQPYGIVGFVATTHEENIPTKEKKTSRNTWVS